MRATPAALKVLRLMGEIPQVVERWNPYAKKHQDLFGFIDIVSTPRGKPGPLRMVQVFSELHGTGERARHLQKILADDTMRNALYSLAANPGVIVETWALKRSVRRGYYFLVTVIGPGAAPVERYWLTMEGEKRRTWGGKHGDKNKARK